MTTRKQPPVSILNPAYQWVPSYMTDIRVRFRKIRESQAAARTVADADTQKVVAIFAARAVEAEDTRR